MRNDQNVGKQDRGIKTESTHRLKRYFDRKLRREAQFEKVAGFLADNLILRQIPSGLPHQPHRRRAPPSVIQDIEQRFVHRAIPGRPFL